MLEFGVRISLKNYLISRKAHLYRLLLVEEQTHLKIVDQREFKVQTQRQNQITKIHLHQLVHTHRTLHLAVVQTLPGHARAPENARLVRPDEHHLRAARLEEDLIHLPI